VPYYQNTAWQQQPRGIFCAIFGISDDFILAKGDFPCIIAPAFKHSEL
jgi:hypothetical protein